MFEPVRGGTRGGQAEFKWSDVSADKDRENYLGHSINAPTGRWQKNKDVHWYNRDIDAGEEERRAEIAKVKQLEADALAAALGYEPAAKTGDGPGSNANAVPLGEGKEPSAIGDSRTPEEKAAEKAAKEERKRQKAERKEEKARRKEEKRLRRHEEEERDHSHSRSHRHEIEYRSRRGYDEGGDEDRRRRHRSRSRSPRRTSGDPSLRRRSRSPPSRYHREPLPPHQARERDADHLPPRDRSRSRERTRYESSRR